MLNLLPWWWRWAALAGLCGAVALFTGVKVHAHDRKVLEALQARYDAFVAQTAYAGKLAEAEAARKIAAGIQAKKDADNENAKTTADLAGMYAAYRSLRDQRKGAGSGVLPAAASGSSDPGRACFDRAALDRGLETADGILQSGAEKILFRGDTAINGLNTGREWAKKSP